MSTKTIINYTDDITGSAKDVETVSFSYQGNDYEIDLSAANRKALDKSLAKYVAAARPAKVAKPRSTSKASTNGDRSEVREWARANGHEVGDRGRIKAEVLEAFMASQGQPQPEAQTA